MFSKKSGSRAFMEGRATRNSKFSFEKSAYAERHLTEHMIDAAFTEQDVIRAKEALARFKKVKGRSAWSKTRLFLKKLVAKLLRLT